MEAAEAEAAAKAGDESMGAKRDKSLGILPDFLSRSGVYGSSAAYGIKSLNADSEGISGALGESAAGEAGVEERKTREGEGESVEESSSVLKVQSLTTAKDTSPEIHQGFAQEADKEADKAAAEDEGDEDDLKWED